jgi:hypothetical protein
MSMKDARYLICFAFTKMLRPHCQSIDVLIFFTCSVALSCTLNLDSHNVDQYFDPEYIEEATNNFRFTRSPNQSFPIRKALAQLLIKSKTMDGFMEQVPTLRADVMIDTKNKEQRHQKRKIFDVLDRVYVALLLALSFVKHN